jgi:outer membrane receptor for ferrienterochelin and colicins
MIARFFLGLFLAALIHGGLHASLLANTHGSTDPDSLSKQPRLPRSKADSTKTYNADQVVITGARNEVLQSASPVRVEVVNAKAMQTTGMVNLANIVQEQTGLAVAAGSVRSGVQMMGLNPDYTLILIDGQPVIGRVAGVIDMARISVGNIQQVEIVKGPMSSLYGSEALAGVINIITRKPVNGFKTRLYGQYITRGPSEAQAELTYGGDRVDVSLFGNFKQSQPFERTQVWSDAANTRTDTLRTPFSGFTDYTLQSRIKWYVADNASLGANVRYFNTRSEGSFTESFFGQIASNRGSVTQNDFSATVSGEWTLGKARLSLQSYASMYNETYNFDVAQGTTGNVDNMLRRISRTLMQYDLLWNLKNRFTLGAEFQYDDASGSRYPDRPFYRTFVAFGQWEGNPTAGSDHDWISYALSARFDATSAFGSSFNPRLSVLLKPFATSDVQFRASFGTGFKAPDFRQLFVEFSNRLPGAGYDLIGAYRLGNTLLPESSVAFDVGAVLNVSNMLHISSDAGSWQFDTRFFRNNLRNLIEYYYVQRVDNRDVYSYHNIANAYTQGVEANLRGAMPLSLQERITLAAGYQWLEAMDVEILNAITAGVAGTVNPSTGAFEPLTRQNYRGLWFRSPHTGNVRLQYEHDALGLAANVRAQYVGTAGDEGLVPPGRYVLGNPPRRAWDRDEYSIPAYWNINCAVSKTFSFSERSSGTTFNLAPSLLRVNVGVNNLLDAINLRSLPGLVGRQFFVNVNVEW